MKEYYDLYSSSQYPWMCFNFFLILWLSSIIIRQILLRSKYQDKFRELSEARQRNIVTYVVELVITTFVFCCQIYGGTDILFQFKDTTSESKLDWSILAIQLIVVLYIWELCYRIDIGWPLLVHHLVTLLLTQLAAASLFDTNDLIYARYALLFGFTATTEQISFVALFAYRLGIYKTWQASLFNAAVIQTVVLKTVVTVLVTVLFIIDIVNGRFDNHPDGWAWFWKIFFVILLIGLYAAQIFAGWILHILSVKCTEKENEQN